MKNHRADKLFRNAELRSQEAEILRGILLECNLTEEIKWRQPCYTHGGKNICILQRMKSFLALLFFQGAFLKDPHDLLQKQGPNSRIGYRICYTSTDEVKQVANLIKDYVDEAIEIEDAGFKIEVEKNLEYPPELSCIFRMDPDFETAFKKLTPGRQRGYILHFSNAKQSKTRTKRIDQYRDKIFTGKGFPLCICVCFTAHSASYGIKCPLPASIFLKLPDSPPLSFMYPRFFFAALTLFLITSPALAQQEITRIVSGSVVDQEDHAPLPGVTVVFETVNDSVLVGAGTANPDGYFAVKSSEHGELRLRLSFIGYAAHEQWITITGPYQSLGTIQLKPDLLQLDEMVVEEIQERMIIRGDTTIFSADAYTVNPDATAEDLIAKLPGIVVQDGQVEAQGEQVQRFTVDGREFFGQDPTAALRNLPADMIQNIEVFDRNSDQAQFTGFKDGNAERTINVVTRRGMSNGQFGQFYGGYGDNQRYITGGNTNIFDGDRRISVIALSNNINQQNFAFQDLLGLTGSDGRGRRGNPRSMMIRGGGVRRGGRPGGGFDPRNFLIGTQSGLNHTTSAGINYSDEIGSRVRLSASYFFNRVSNENDAFLDHELFLSGDQSQFYNESTRSSSMNLNHRLNARIEYTINDANSLIIRPSLSFQNNSAASLQSGINSLV